MVLSFKRFVAAAVTSGSLLFVQTALAADTTIVSGSVTDQDSVAIANAQIECLVGNSTPVTATADSSGNYSCVADSSVLTVGSTSIMVQPRAVEGYASPQQQQFTWNGTVQTYNFQYTQANKIINVTVVDEDGVEVEGVQVTAQPINIEAGENASQEQEDFQGGTGDLEVTGGDWIVKADANLSEQSPERYPWVSITQPQKVSFSDNTDAETAELVFVVANSSQKATITLTDKDGNTLNDGFVADVYFEGFSGKYGTMVTNRKVNATTGSISVYLLPGVWKVSAYDSQLQDQSFDPAEVTFVLTDDGQDADWGTVAAVENTASLTGTLNIDGATADAPIELIATNVDTGYQVTGSSNTAGEFNFDKLPLGEYAVTVADGNYIPTQTVTADLTTADSAAADLEIKANEADMTVNGRLVDSNGAFLTNVPGTVVVENKNVEFSAPVDSDGRFEVAMSSAGLEGKTLDLTFVAQPGAEVFAPDTVSVEVEEDGMVSTELEMSSDEATISGNITNLSGGELTSENFGDQASVLALNVVSGATELAEVNSDGSYSLEVGPGNWTVIPQFDGTDAEVFAATGSSVTANVEAGDTKTKDLEVMPLNSTVEITVTDPTGDPVPEAPVLFTNLPALQAEASAKNAAVDESAVVQITGTANAAGVVTETLPAGEYTAYFGTNPNVEAFAEPQAIEFTATSDKTKELEAEYRNATATVSGDLGKNFDVASVTLSSPDGGTETLTVDGSGEFSGAVSPGEWDLLASGVKNGEVFVATETVTVEKGDNSVSPTLTGTDLDFPAAVTVTGAADEAIVVSNDAGASVSLPAYGASFDSDVTVTLQPVITFGDTGDVSQVGLAYDVTIVDGEGLPVKALNSDATITLPIDEALAGNVGADEMTGTYYNPDLQSFLSDGVAATTNGSEMVIQTEHLSRFAVTTTGDISASAPGKVKAKTLKAKKITAKTAVLSWKAPANSEVTKYVLQVRKHGAKKSQWMKYNKVTALKKKITKLKGETMYHYRVKACNTAGCSDYTTWKEFTTL